jgi:hypothetical protein
LGGWAQQLQAGALHSVQAVAHRRTDSVAAGVAWPAHVSYVMWTADASTPPACRPCALVMEVSLGGLESGAAFSDPYLPYDCSTGLLWDGTGWLHWSGVSRGALAQRAERLFYLWAPSMHACSMVDCAGRRVEARRSALHAQSDRCLRIALPPTRRVTRMRAWGSTGFALELHACMDSPGERVRMGQIRGHGTYPRPSFPTCTI